MTEVCLCMTLMFFFSSVVYAEKIKLHLRSSVYANCLCVNEKITFKPESVIPADMAAIQISVCNSNGNKVFEKEIAASVFRNNGVSWKIAEAGFYEVKFYLKDKSGKVFDCYDSFIKKTYKWSGDKPRLIAEEEFKKNTVNIAVFPSPTRKPDEIPPQVGVSIGWNVYKSSAPYYQIKLANILGFNFIRLHPILWAKIEPEQNRFQWDKLDAFINEARSAGYNKFIGNVFGTPQWASSNPEKKFHIIWRYMAYAPKDMKYWTDFLQTVIKRYPFIKDWELWNEPHLPGQSCFWHESPEKYVELLKAGYDTVKKVQPDSRVLLGGIGMRYLPFYDRIIEDGAGKYFDVLSLHLGWGQEGSYIQPFNAIDKKNGVKPKPWLCSEWHSVLVSGGDIPLPSEKKIARNMVLSFIDQLNDGAEKITFFGLTPSSNEIETLKFLMKNGGFAQAGGIFRGYPYLEPRFAVVAWRNFIDLFSGEKIEYLGGYSFNDAKQFAMHMKSASGSVVIIWNNENEKLSMNKQLADVIGSKSKLIDWEGRSVSYSSSDNINLQPECMYYVINPNLEPIKKWQKNNVVLSRHRGNVEIKHEVRGLYHVGRIFDDSMKIISPESLNWLNCLEYTPMNGNKQKQSDFSAVYAVGMDSAGMDLIIKIHDDIHFQNDIGGNLWKGDSVQFALDTERKGRKNDRLEFQVGLGPNGAILWKEVAPAIRGDLPSRYSRPGSPAQYSQVVIDRKDNTTIYKIHLDKDDLYPYTYMNNDPLRFSLLINNNNGNGREGYLRWADGIGLTKKCPT